MNMATLKKMSKVERLQAMEALWDSLLYEGVELDTPKWHEKILEDRKNMISNAPMLSRRLWMELQEQYGLQNLMQMSQY